MNNNNTTRPALVLASSSPYRRELLARLHIPFSCDSPDIDETIQDHEPADELVVRLATAKAMKMAGKYPTAIIIGADQVLVLQDKILSKPETHEQAVLQLRKASGKKVVFYTGLCVLNSKCNTVQSECIPFTVKFRILDDAEIERYLKTEKPYDCAGSFKSEGLGISLIEYMHGDDHSALIGLPLIRLCEMLRREGITVP